jgi:hypothetical protein
MSPNSVDGGVQMWACPNIYCDMEIPLREPTRIQIHLLEEIFESVRRETP